MLELELKASHDQVSMYDEMLRAKDESIQTLRAALERMPGGGSDQPDVVQMMGTRDSTQSAERVEMNELQRYKVGKKKKEKLDVVHQV